MNVVAIHSVLQQRCEYLKARLEERVRETAELEARLGERDQTITNLQQENADLRQKIATRDLTIETLGAASEILQRSYSGMQSVMPSM